MYVDDYRRLGAERRKNVYRAYASIFENISFNQDIRDDLTGMIFENENGVFTFKLYYPVTFRDVRLLYQPIEIMKIGKDKKTTIPVKVYGITSGYNFNVIDSEIYDVDVYDSIVYDSTIVFDSNNG